MLNLNWTHRDVTYKLGDQGPAGIEEGDAYTEAMRQGGSPGSWGYVGHEIEVVEDRGNGSWEHQQFSGVDYSNFLGIFF